jgi:AraC family ethanolamine operon transcriptional activator
MTHQNAVARIESHDVDELSMLVKPWELILKPVSLGPFHCLLECVQVNGILVYREHLALRQIATGSTPAGYFTFGGPLPASKPVDWCGIESTSKQLCYGRPVTEVDFILPEGSDHIAILIPTDLMRSYFGEETIEAALSDQRRSLVCTAQHDCNLLTTTARIISKYLGHPELLADAHECKAIESQLMSGVAEIFPYDNTGVHCTTPTRRRKAFLHAIEISENLRKLVTLPELAVATNISQRSLRLAFQEAIDISPLKYLRLQRMHKVHHDLNTKDTAATSVTEVASHWGFNELGRFAVEYKQLFGESPSITLSNRTTSTSRRIIDILP